MTDLDLDAITPCPGCPELRLDCHCVTSLEAMSLADVKAVFADECVGHEWPDCGGHNHDEALSVDPAPDPCRWCGSTLARCLAWNRDPNPGHVKCCPDCSHPSERKATS